MKTFWLIAVFMFFISCGESEKPGKIEFEIDIEKAENTSSRSLTANQVYNYTNTMILTIDSSVNIESITKSYFLIDSLKKNNQYLHYYQNLKIGMIADIGAYMVKIIKKNDLEKYVFWKIQYKTHDAIPFSYGTFVLLSHFKNDSLLYTYEAAHKIFKGNPPDFTISRLNSVVEANKISVKGFEIKGDDIKKDSIAYVKTILMK